MHHLIILCIRLCLNLSLPTGCRNGIICQLLEPQSHKVVASKDLSNNSIMATGKERLVDREFNFEGIIIRQPFAYLDMIYSEAQFYTASLLNSVVDVLQIPVYPSLLFQVHQPPKAISSID